MNVRYSLSRLVLFTAALISFIPFSKGAETPTAEIRATVDKVLTLLKESSLTEAERRKQLRDVIYPRFDFQQMAASSLGFYWRQLNSAQRQEFADAFVALLEDTYIERIESYQGETVNYVGETLEGSYAEVKTILTSSRRGTQVSINYRMLLRDDDWKVYDVVIENISLINNYRAQFDRVIAQSSFEDLLRKMREKQMELKKSPRVNDNFTE